jgi:hypothetical protein
MRRQSQRRRPSQTSSCTLALPVGDRRKGDMYALTVFPDCKEFGGRAPGILERSVIAQTARVPNNGLDLRLAILLRRILKSTRS